MKLTQKQETFTQNLFKGMSQREAYIEAGYSPKSSMATIDNHACQLANCGKVVARWDELKKKVEDASVATVLERKQRLTVFVREDNYGKFGISRQSNIAASDQLNKMEKIYAETTVNVDNRTLNINVGDPKEKLISLLSRLAIRAGETEGDTGTEPERS